jgi:hypothetical protein
LQTVALIESIQWILAQYDEKTQTVLFESEYFDIKKFKDEALLMSFIGATHELSRASVSIFQNNRAVQVLKAFNLETLIDKDFITELAMAISNKDKHETIPDLVNQIAPQWKAMLASVNPLESLINLDIMNNNFPDKEILSLVFRVKGLKFPTLKDILKVFSHLQQAYSVVAHIYGKGNEDRMDIVHIEGDQSIRIDCTGSNELIKPLKEFMIQSWSKTRNKRLDNLMVKGIRLLSTLPVMDQISALEKDNAIDSAVSEQLRRRLLTAVLGLYDLEALPLELSKRNNPIHSVTTPSSAHSTKSANATQPIVIPQNL